MSITTKTIKIFEPLISGFVESEVLSEKEAKYINAILHQAIKPVDKLRKVKSKLLTTKEAAERLGVCSKTILRMRTSGRLNHIKLTGSAKSLRFYEEEIENLVSNGGRKDA